MIKAKNIELTSVPIVGKLYHFWDDGKFSPSRHYICRCERVINKKESKIIEFVMKDYYDLNDNTKVLEYKASLYDIWFIQKNEHKWFFNEDTDYFVEISCPKYDENNLWAVRTKNGKWFTLDIQSSWQGGLIDVDGRQYEQICDECLDNGNYEILLEYQNETYE